MFTYDCGFLVFAACARGQHDPITKFGIFGIISAIVSTVVSPSFSLSPFYIRFVSLAVCSASGTYTDTRSKF